MVTHTGINPTDIGDLDGDICTHGDFDDLRIDRKVGRTQLIGVDRAIESDGGKGITIDNLSVQISLLKCERTVRRRKVALRELERLCLCGHLYEREEAQ